MTDRSTIVLFLNRKAGSGAGRQLVSDLAELLSRKNFDVVTIDSLKELAEFANLARESGRRIHCVISAGGDGTVEAVANRIDPEIPICIFPLGTENLLAKYLELEAHPREIAEIIQRCKTVRVDAGLANGKLFLIVLSCGFDADVVRRVHAKRKGNITHFAYARPIIKAMRRYRFPRLTLEWQGADEQWQKFDCHWVFAFNMPSYAAGLQIVSESNPSDGMFELASFKGGSFWQGVKQFVSVVFGQHHRLSGFQLHRCRRFKISSPAKNVAFQIDGDPGGVLPVEVEVLPRHLTLIVNEE